MWDCIRRRKLIVLQEKCVGKGENDWYSQSRPSLFWEDKYLEFLLTREITTATAGLVQTGYWRYLTFLVSDSILASCLTLSEFYLGLCSLWPYFLWQSQLTAHRKKKCEKLSLRRAAWLGPKFPSFFGFKCSHMTELLIMKYERTLSTRTSHGTFFILFPSGLLVSEDSGPVGGRAMIYKEPASLNHHWRKSAHPLKNLNWTVKWVGINFYCVITQIL